MPKPVVPYNDPGPWVAAIDELLTDSAAYRRESESSRAVAERFVSGLDAGDLERFLQGLRPGVAGRVERPTIETLSPEKRALLLERLHKRRLVR
jgi:hypothetical protein